LALYSVTSTGRKPVQRGLGTSEYTAFGSFHVELDQVEARDWVIVDPFVEPDSCHILDADRVRHFTAGDDVRLFGIAQPRLCSEAEAPPATPRSGPGYASGGIPERGVDERDQRLRFGERGGILPQVTKAVPTRLEGNHLSSCGERGECERVCANVCADIEADPVGRHEPFEDGADVRLPAVT
jgi:hypothetical protein